MQAGAHLRTTFVDSSNETACGPKICSILVPALAEVLEHQGDALSGEILQWSDKRLLIDLKNPAEVREGPVQVLLECEEWVVLVDATLRKFDWLLWDDQKKVCVDMQGVGDGILSLLRSSHTASGVPTSAAIPNNSSLRASVEPLAR